MIAVKNPPNISTEIQLHNNGKTKTFFQSPGAEYQRMQDEHNNL